MDQRTAAKEKAYKAEAERHQRDALILDHLGFVRHILGRVVAELPSHVDFENLEAAGVLGLVEAAMQFDAARGVEFKTFAFRRIRGAILDELRRNSPLPQRILKLISIVNKACDEVEAPATPESLAAYTGLPLEDVESTLSAMRMRRMHSWDDANGWLSELADIRERQPDSELEREETLQIMTAALEQLPENERLVITLYHLEDLRLREIGDLLQLSESRISRLLSKAEFRLGQIVKRANR